MKSIKLTARVTGVLYLIIFVLAIFSNFFVLEGVKVTGDASATAQNIIANQGLFRLGFVSFTLVYLADVAISILLYILLKPVGKILSLLAASFRLVMSAIFGINLINWFIPLLLLRGETYLTVFEADQVHALVTLSLNAFTVGFNIGLVFFGVHCILVGYLIFKSGYMPKMLGGLMVVAGVGYMADSWGILVIPNYNPTLTAIFLVPAVIAELWLTLWLIIKGVDDQGWADRVPASAGSLAPQRA